MPDRFHLPRRLIALGRALGDLLRGAGGTGGYERYCAHHALHHAGTPPLDRAEWFRRREDERWTGVNRCC